MAKILTHAYDVECQLFRYINQYFNRRSNTFFRIITNAGGAKFTIFMVLTLMLLTANDLQLAAVASAIALTVSHLPVAIAKKLFPRSRPYLVLKKIYVTDNPLKDHSFPSGHTTAIFSILIPFVLFDPLLGIILLPLGVLVGLSRIVLGLHYPSDVIAGCLLGTAVGVLSFMIMLQF